MLLADERAEVVAVCRRLVAERLVVGTAGNVSVRAGDLVAVTPSGVDYGTLTADQVGVHRLDGTPVQAPLAPTSEAPMHLACYAAHPAGAVVHTHSVAATALSCLVDEVPPVHYYLGCSAGGCGSRGTPATAPRSWPRTCWPRSATAPACCSPTTAP
ncbi:hypothetical protein NUM_62650 [Actinocatenispora comari]|uniref:Class II aldolase/adducin N-terminal domain-containing protein n=1 Tax=Actinocatenispora comari TaxID=2807577 RepID=A0A8J4ENV7_9ACTN|nr:class II aldolase/adducin family protein [Actinocatenispora comari]GIL31011.1 hypothetical protein NUM_62650 [Actinocatenispora comari]